MACWYDNTPPLARTSPFRTFPLLICRVISVIACGICVSNFDVDERRLVNTHVHGIIISSAPEGRQASQEGQRFARVGDRDAEMLTR